MHRHATTTLDAAAKLLHARDGVTYPVVCVVRGAESLYCEPLLDGDAPYGRRQCWLIPSHGWVINRLVDRPTSAGPAPFDWYIDIDRIAVDGDGWMLADGLLDLIVIEGVRGTLLDADEFADDLADGTVPVDEAAELLRSLHTLQTMLARLDWSVAALLAEIAPDLPC